MKNIDEVRSIQFFLKHLNNFLKKIGIKGNLYYNNENEVINGVLNNQKIEINIFATSIEYAILSVFEAISKQKYLFDIETPKVKNSATKMPNSAKFTEQEIQYYFQQAETPYIRKENEEI